MVSEQKAELSLTDVESELLGDHLGVVGSGRFCFREETTGEGDTVPEQTGQLLGPRRPPDPEFPRF